MITDPRSERFGGAVLAGGASRRMGRDKAFVRLRGETLLERSHRALVDAGADPVVVVGGDADRIAELGLKPVPDRNPGSGPLDGVITALEQIPTDIVVVLACDHVEPSADAVRAVVGSLGESDVAVPVSDGREQWLHAAWRRRARPELEAAYADGVRAPRQVADRLTVTWLSDGDPCWYRDADRPSDLPGAQP